MKSAILTLIYGLSAVFGALSIKLLDPTKKTMWTTGSDVELYWKLEGTSDEKSVKIIELDLMQGRDQKPQLVDNIAFGVHLNHGDAFWTVDKNLKTGDDYFIRITSPDDPNFIHESEYFTIRNMPNNKKDKKGRSGEKAISQEANGAGEFVPTASVLMATIAMLAFIF